MMGKEIIINYVVSFVILENAIHDMLYSVKLIGNTNGNVITSSYVLKD